MTRTRARPRFTGAETSKEDKVDQENPDHESRVTYERPEIEKRVELSALMIKPIS